MAAPFETAWYQYNRTADHELKAAPTRHWLGLTEQEKDYLTLLLNEMPTEYRWPAELVDMFMGKGPLTDEETRSLAEFVWLLYKAPWHMINWLKCRKRFRNSAHLQEFRDMFFLLNDMIPNQKRLAARHMLRNLVLGDLKDEAYNPWATLKYKGVVGPFHYDHRVQAKWTGDVPIVMPELRISFMPFDSDLHTPEESSPLATLRKDRMALIAKTREEIAHEIKSQEENIKAVEKELRLMTDIRQSIEKSYRSYQELRERFQTQMQVLQAKMRAFKYEEDTLREFSE
jgi:hypothetical protein